MCRIIFVAMKTIASIIKHDSGLMHYLLSVTSQSARLPLAWDLWHRLSKAFEINFEGTIIKTRKPSYR